MDRREILEQWVMRHQDEMVETLKEFVRIPSVSRRDLGDMNIHAPFGPDCRKMLDFALRKGEAFGFRTEDHDGYCGSVLYGDAADEIGFVAHLDVVPEGGGWIYAPYEPVEKDGFLIGRGTADNKSAAVSGLFLMRFLRDMGIPMKKTFRLMLGCSEETGMQDYSHYVKNGGKVPAFGIVSDAGFPVCYAEKGGWNAELYVKKGADLVSFEAGNVRNAIPDLAIMTIRHPGLSFEAVSELLKPYEKLDVIELPDGLIEIRCHGMGGHAASPDGTDNAAVSLSKYLTESGLTEKLDLSALPYIAATFTDAFGTGMGFACEDEMSGRLTSNLGVVRTEGDELHLSLDIRFPVTCDIGILTENFRKRTEADGVRLCDVDIEKAFYIDPADEKVQILQAMYKEVTGEESEPYTMGGGTYSRVIPNAITFGPGLKTDPADFLPEGHGSAHGPDEVLNIEGWLKAFRIYALALLKLEAADG